MQARAKSDSPHSELGGKAGPLGSCATPENDPRKISTEPPRMARPDLTLELQHA